MTHPRPADTDAENQAAAAEWVLRLREPNLDPEVTAEWLVWCGSDPRNREAFEAMAELWELSGNLDRVALAPPNDAPATSILSRLYSRRLHRWALASFTAALLLLASTLAFRNPLDIGPGAIETARIETDTGQVESQALADGSRIDVGGRSAVLVRYTDRSRLVIAESGETFFDIVENRNRPFIVRAGPLTITAVGTAFSVQREDGSVTVTVTEGVVEVLADPDGAAGPALEPTTLRAAAGQRVRFDRGELSKSLEPKAAGGPAIVERWREGRLEFRDEPLRLVVARINRYSPTQIQVSDREIEDLRVTATVYGDRVDAWLAGLEAVLPVRVIRTVDGHAAITAATAAPRE